MGLRSPRGPGHTGGSGKQKYGELHLASDGQTILQPPLSLRRNNSMHPSPFQDLILHGERLFHTGYVHEALHVFESVIAQEPHHVLALNNKGVILHSLGRYAEAEQMFLDSLYQDNNNANAVFNLASMYIEKCNI